MRKDDVKVGATYVVRVSGFFVPVKIVGKRPGPKPRWIGVNLKTGRTIYFKNSARLREEILSERDIEYLKTHDVMLVW